MDLLADRLAEIVGLGRREAADVLGDLHRLLLVDRDAEGEAGDRLEARVDVRDRLEPVLAARVDGDVLHRARPVEGDERDQVLELGRLDLAQRLAHPRRLELEDADRVAALQQLVGLLVVERDRLDVDVAVRRTQQLDGLLDHVEVAEAEEVHLQQPERLDVAHRQLCDDFRVGALLLDRDDLGQRAVGDDDARGVDRVGADEALERLRQVDDLADDRIGVVGLLELGAGLEVVVEVDLRAFRDHLRDPVDGAVRDLEHPAGVADGGAGHHRREGDDLRDAVAAVLLGDVVDHALAAGYREVDVHVRHRLAAWVEEALEEQPVADRVDVGDLEAVGGERAGGRTAARADLDAVGLREVDEVPDDQEVVREAHLADRLQLEREAVLELRRDLVVAAAEARLAELGEVLEGITAVGRVELGEQEPVGLDLDVAALGDLERAAHRVLVTDEVERHLLGRLEVELVGIEPPVVRVLQRVAGLDAEQRLVCARVVVHEVVDVAGGDERQAGRLGELRELRVDPHLLLEARVLDLDVGLVAPEDLDEPVEVGGGVGGAVLLERLADAAGEAAGKDDEPLRVPLEQLPVDARLVVVALEVAERGELDQVRVALVGLREDGQVRVALLLPPAVIADIDLAAHDRLDPLLPGLALELDRARKRAVIGERDCRHPELCGPRGERRDAAGSVEDRILGVDVEMDEVGLGHWGLHSTPALGGLDFSARRCR